MSQDSAAVASIRATLRTFEGPSRQPVTKWGEGYLAACQDLLEQVTKVEEDAMTEQPT